MLLLFGPRLRTVGLREQEIIVSESPWARLVMVPFLLLFALLCFLFLFLPAALLVLPFPFAIPFPVVGSHDFLTWLELWPMGLFMAVVFAIPAWISWPAVIPRWLHLNLAEQKYALYEGFCIGRRTFTGSFDDISFLIVKRSKDNPFRDMYRTELVWKMKRRQMTLWCSYEDFPRVKVFAEEMSAKLGAPFISVSNDIL